MIARDRELLAHLSRVNTRMGTATIELMNQLEDGMLPAESLRRLGAHLGALAEALTARAEELDGAARDHSPTAVDGS
ncbi:hypothetical protein H0B56_22385 [Haloechinothrix sp. YIM 98757]|uniref:Uncharacterized protein n=1 Tax=Haloechinothrix aidingensis TaxID=2752311 RepID=A0A838AGB7_9PSEU|nr:hypothetical protein [Haloechinothrix aidingensis]MBA0128303.1 hypothetical protein [Haloechinothrix aidingensis]